MYICAGRVGYESLCWYIWCRPKFTNEQYFFVCKLGLGKEVVSLSLVVTEVYFGEVE